MKAGYGRGLQHFPFSTQGMPAQALLDNLASPRTDTDERKLAGIFQKQSLEQDSSSLMWTPGISTRETKARSSSIMSAKMTTDKPNSIDS